MSCRERPDYAGGLAPSAIVKMGEFEVAMGGGIWVAAGGMITSGALIRFRRRSRSIQSLPVLTVTNVPSKSKKAAVRAFVLSNISGEFILGGCRKLFSVCLTGRGQAL